jgi:hypothetical protein
MLEEVLRVEGPLLHQPLVRRASGGLPESPDEMAGRHAASLAEFVRGRRVADSDEQNSLAMRSCHDASPPRLRYGVDAAVAYHGGDTEKYRGEVDGLDAPLLMHLAKEDEFISKPTQAEIKTALAGKPNATVYSYPGQRHAFARHNGAHYNAAAAALANRRTSEFLHQQLR